VDVEGTDGVGVFQDMAPKCQPEAGGWSEEDFAQMGPALADGRREGETKKDRVALEETERDQHLPPATFLIGAWASNANSAEYTRLLAGRRCADAWRLGAGKGWKGRTGRRQGEASAATCVDFSVYLVVDPFAIARKLTESIRLETGAVADHRIRNSRVDQIYLQHVRQGCAAIGKTGNRMICVELPQLLLR
jgi:hypothetical protein